MLLPQLYRRDFDMKFVHAADIHLDSPLRGLERYEGAPVDEIREATRRAFENLVNLCLGEEVCFIGQRPVRVREPGRQVSEDGAHGLGQDVAASASGVSRQLTPAYVAPECPPALPGPRPGGGRWRVRG